MTHYQMIQLSGSIAGECQVWPGEVPILVQVVGFHPEIEPHLLLALAAIRKRIALDCAHCMDRPVPVVNDPIDSRLANQLTRREVSTAIG